MFIFFKCIKYNKLYICIKWKLNEMRINQSNRIDVFVAGTCPPNTRRTGSTSRNQSQTKMTSRVDSFLYMHFLLWMQMSLSSTYVNFHEFLNLKWKIFIFILFKLKMKNESFTVSHKKIHLYWYVWKICMLIWTLMYSQLRVWREDVPGCPPEGQPPTGEEGVCDL